MEQTFKLLNLHELDRLSFDMISGATAALERLVPSRQRSEFRCQNS